MRLYSKWLIAFLPYMIQIDGLFNSVSIMRFPPKSTCTIVKDFSQRIAPLKDSCITETMNWDPKSAPKLDFSEDFYSLLEVDSNCDLEILKKAYHKMILKYHPDNRKTQADKDLGNKQMMVINNAYKILRDFESRQLYDNQRRDRSSGFGAGRAGLREEAVAQKATKQSVNIELNYKAINEPTAEHNTAKPSLIIELSKAENRNPVDLNAPKKQLTAEIKIDSAVLSSLLKDIKSWLK